MDQVLSQLFPIQKIGSDGFNWWVGQIEGTASDEKNNKGGYRYKVRIVGDHPQSKEILDTKDLPWANVMMPVNVPFMPGNVGGANPQLIKGCWVVGFYLDNEKQKPLIMGSIGQTPGATTVVNNERPGDTSSFKTISSSASRPNQPATDGAPVAENPEGGEGPVNKVTGALSDGSCDENGEEKVPTPDRKKVGQDQEKWCQEVAEKCEEPDLKNRITIVLGEFLNEIQKNNGNIGSYLVGEVNGKITSAVGEGRKYISKIMRIVREFIAKVKGFVISKIKEGVKALIDALLAPTPTGNALTPVTEWFNTQLKDLGCKMADLGERLEKWLTNVLMSYISQAYRAAFCLVDTLVNGIISKINSLLEDILGSVLGPLQDILGAVAIPLNIIGGAINFALKLLGITCSGPNTDCAKYKTVCTTGEKKEKEDEKDFLDNLLTGIDNLFPDTPADYTQYTCEDAYTGKPLTSTNIGFTGGVPKPTGTDDPNTLTSIPQTKRQRLIYDIQDISVEEGQVAVFTVIRTGYTETASSLKYETLKTKGTATPDTDYLPQTDILGFAPGETQKTISIRTFYSSDREADEDFYVRLRLNSPDPESGTVSSFINNIGKCTITERNLTNPNIRYPIIPENPLEGIDDLISTRNDIVGDTGDGDTGDGDETDITTLTYSVVADKPTVKEGEFVTYTINTKNVSDGTKLFYTLSGTNITGVDIIGGLLTGSFTINNDTAQIIVGIENNETAEDDEILRFTVNGTGAFVDVTIISNSVSSANDLSDYDESTDSTDSRNVYEEFTPPVINIDRVITDPNGGIIEIPIDNPGDPWAEPPYVFIGGEGIGAIATPLLDEDGFITEIRIKSPGYGYKLNLPSNNNVRCIVDTFTIISPGQGYTSPPDVYVNGELGVAEAIINDDGFVIGARTLNRELTFEELPEIVVVGGGGYGATMIPSLVCLDTEELTTIGSTKIGTGRYVDCP